MLASQNAPLFRKYGHPLMYLLLIAAVLELTSSCGRSEKFSLSTDYMTIRFDKEGDIIGFQDKASSRQYSPPNTQSPLLTLYKDSTYIKPSAAQYDQADSTITLRYPNGSVALLHAVALKNYIRLQLVSLEPRNGVEAVVWGPYHTTISQQIGETIGVVRDHDFAIGVQGLQINTIEGLPDQGDDAGGRAVIDPLPGQSLPDSLKDKIGQTVNVNVNIDGDMPAYVRLYRGNAARKNASGSEIGLFSRDRRQARTTGPANNLQYVAAVQEDLVGSAIAIFGCPEPLALDMIGKIELGEGLPHPMLDGVWMKRSPSLGQPYMLYEDGKNWEQALRYAKACNFHLIHLGEVFTTWGHFGISADRFAGDAEGIRKLAALAGKDSIRLGIHTLTMFTGTNDAYVSPIPSDSLCKAGSTVLEKRASSADQVIYIRDPSFFKNGGSTHTVKIGKELIAYGRLSEDRPWRLLDCSRGQFGTTITDHGTGDTIDKLVNNDYKGFYPDIRLQDEYAQRLASVCNETGIGLMDFDGFGGGSPTGHGAYGAARFLDLWYRSLHKYVLACGAGTFHYGWHIHSFMNWGEPWYNALRQSQVNYRIENQRYFERNLLPGMLGWFTLQNDYRPEEIEWIQARSVGFNAGYLLKIENDIEKNGYKTQLFGAVKEWQMARNLHVFSASQVERMKDAANEFHLEREGDSSWNLYPIKLQTGFVHKYRPAQSGEPLTSTFKPVNPYSAQPIQFYLMASKAAGENPPAVSGIKILINNYRTIEISEELKAGQKLVCNGREIYICDANWNRLKSIPMAPLPNWEKGVNEIAVSSRFTGEPPVELNLECKFVGPSEHLSVTRR